MADDPGSIRFLPDGVDVPGVPGESLLSHALRGGVPLLSPCGGESRCGKCRVVVTGETRGGEDPGTLTRAEIAAGIRLACRCFPSSGDVSVTILPGSRPARLAAYLDGKDLAGDEPFLPPVPRRIGRRSARGGAGPGDEHPGRHARGSLGRNRPVPRDGGQPADGVRRGPHLPRGVRRRDDRRVRTAAGPAPFGGERPGAATPRSLPGVGGSHGRRRRGEHRHLPLPVRDLPLPDPAAAVPSGTEGVPRRAGRNLGDRSGDGAGDVEDLPVRRGVRRRRRRGGHSRFGDAPAGGGQPPLRRRHQRGGGAGEQGLADRLLLLRRARLRGRRGRLRHARVPRSDRVGPDRTGERGGGVDGDRADPAGGPVRLGNPRPVRRAVPGRDRRSLGTVHLPRRRRAPLHGARRRRSSWSPGRRAPRAATWSSASRT